MFSPEQSILLVIDIQGKLASLMRDKDILFQNVSKLIQCANLLEIPIIVTEQVPEKIGATVPEIDDVLKEHQKFSKTSFSCCREVHFMQELEVLGRNQVIVTGIEAHVCVYQTVCDLLEKKYDVQVVSDAVSSRSVDNKYFALDRIKCLGGGVTSSEMIICELLNTSEHLKFKEIMKLIK